MIDPIAKLHSPTGALISVYVNRRPQSTRAALVDLVKPLRNSHRPRPVEKSIRSDGERIVDLAGRIETDSAPAAAIFASHAEGVFEYLPLTSPVDDVAMVGPRPHLRPLRAQPRPMRVGILVADSGRARTYLMSGGGFHELGEELTADRGKDNYGGFAGYEEQRIRSRADEVSTHLWREAGRRLLEAHQDQPLEVVVVGGHEEAFDAMASQLHTYLQDLPQGRIVVDPHTLTRAELIAMVEKEVSAQRTLREEATLGRLLAEVGRGGEAVVGLSGALAACNAHAVDHLVVAGPYSKPGVICDSCGWLSRTGAECPVCGAGTFEIGDVVSAAMDATIEAGGRVDIVSVASPLDASGVGALLRFRVDAAG